MKAPLLEHLSPQEALSLCQSLRKDLIASVSQTGGHLSSNLGTIELTVAIHRVFDTKTDRLVFDVGHQCYAHKMLTGRREDFPTLRQYQGIAGFPKPSESIHDAFVAGHASNSIAVALGMAQARALTEQDYAVIALLGDGALTGGLAYEGLAASGQLQGQMLVILNDNGMSITKNVGGVSNYLGKQRLKPQYLQFRRLYRSVLNKNTLGKKVHHMNHRIKQAVKHSLFPCSLFEQLGFTYYGPVDAHDLSALTKILAFAKEQETPVLLHVRSTKGKGYLPAENSPDAFHGVPAFDPTADTLQTKAPPSGEKTFSKVLGETMVDLGQTVPELCGITAAMPTGTGLDIFGKAYPQRLYDVGIAEGCAVSMAGGLAKQGAVPVFAVYSTFLQRAYDMILHDVALENLHVIFAVDRCGLVGEDGETHHGVFDLAFLSTVPHLTLLAPSSLQELADMLRWAVLKAKGAVALRYPRGSQGKYTQGYSGEAVDVLQTGTDITLLSHGIHINHVIDCGEALAKQGISCEILKVNQISPLDTGRILDSVRKTGHLLLAEDVISTGSLGEQVSQAIATAGISVDIALVNSGESFVPHGKVSILEETIGLDLKSLVQTALEVLTDGERN